MAWRRASAERIMFLICSSLKGQLVYVNSLCHKLQTPSVSNFAISATALGNTDVVELIAQGKYKLHPRFINFWH